MKTSTHLERRDGKSDPVIITAGGKEIKTRPYAKGGGKPHIIEEGQLFAGRVQGGGKRQQIYGTRDYGSGYPNGGILRGVNGRGFPFYFWPVIWTNPFIVHSGDAYLHPIEYGLPENTTRPGGQLTVLTYISNMPAGTTFRVLTDFTSAATLIPNLTLCAPFVNLSSAMPMPYLTYDVIPLPEQALQYYRASSAVLTLDGYNNTAALGPQGSIPSYNALLPADTDTELMHCLNDTIGSALLLNDGPHGLSEIAIFFISFGSFIGALLLLWTCCFIAALRKKRKYMAQTNRCPTQPLPSPSLPCTINPPPKVIVLPGRDQQFSSGKAGELYDYDDEASLTKNAQAIAGAKNDPAPSYYEGNKDSWTVPSSWVSFGKTSKEYENIEMGVKRNGQ
ncbi:hypothetical protein H0H87_012467 [Tephrocybe sp. NHM501043]|nr:hypothetical protein H0H87_012467 [Tephrocybe sp. NHM501043]